MSVFVKLGICRTSDVVRMCISHDFRTFQSDFQAKVSLSLVAAWTAEAKLREAEAADLRRPEHGKIMV
jgi:hypothetical protein